MNDSPKLTADWIEIVQLLNQFGMAIDLRDWSSFQSLFADEVEFDYSSIGEVAGTLQPEEIANTARQDLGGFQTTQHVITNHIVERSANSNSATCYAHVRAQHFLPNDRFDPMLQIGGYYQAKLIRIDSGWKIKDWKFTILWSIGSLELFDLAKQESSQTKA